MALQGPIPVDFPQVFPRGVYAAGPFERSGTSRHPKATGSSSPRTSTPGSPCGWPR
jgi:hypothetical protein